MRFVCQVRRRARASDAHLLRPLWFVCTVHGECTVIHTHTHVCRRRRRRPAARADRRRRDAGDAGDLKTGPAHYDWKRAARGVPTDGSSDLTDRQGLGGVPYGFRIVVERTARYPLSMTREREAVTGDPPATESDERSEGRGPAGSPGAVSFHPHDHWYQRC